MVTSHCCARNCVLVSDDQTRFLSKRDVFLNIIKLDVERTNMILQAKRMDFGVNDVKRRCARPQERAYEMLRSAILYKEKPGIDVWRGPRPNLEQLHSKRKRHYFFAHTHVRKQ